MLNALHCDASMLRWNWIGSHSLSLSLSHSLCIIPCLSVSLFLIPSLYFSPNNFSLFSFLSLSSSLRCFFSFIPPSFLHFFALFSLNQVRFSFSFYFLVYLLFCFLSIISSHSSHSLKWLVLECNTRSPSYSLMDYFILATKFSSVHKKEAGEQVFDRISVTCGATAARDTFLKSK